MVCFYSVLTADLKLGGRLEENASNSESDPCVDMTSDDQLRSSGVVRRLSADDIRDRHDWRIIDDIEDADERWNMAAGTDGNDTNVIMDGGAAELMGLRRGSAPEMSHAFGSDDGDRLHEDTDNEDNADDDSNAPGDDSEVQVAMAASPAAAARWLFPAAIAALPLGARMLPNLTCAPPSQPSTIGRDSNVKLAAMENTDVAVAQFAENNILPADVAALNVVLWNLHQQQMFQMHMILQLQQQIIYATAASGGAGGVVGGLPAVPCADPQRNATLPDVLQNNKADDSSAVLNPVPGSSSAATGFRDALYKPLVPGDAAATAMEKSTDIPSSTTVVDGASGSRAEIRSPVTYVSAPSVTTVPPMLAMMDMSLGRLEPPAKEGMIFVFTFIHRTGCNKYTNIHNNNRLHTAN